MRGFPAQCGPTSSSNDTRAATRSAPMRLRRRLVDEHGGADVRRPARDDRLRERADRAPRGDPVVDHEHAVVRREVERPGEEHLGRASPGRPRHGAPIGSGMVPLVLAGEHQADTERGRGQRPEDRTACLRGAHLRDARRHEGGGERRAERGAATRRRGAHRRRPGAPPPTGTPHAAVRSHDRASGSRRRRRRSASRRVWTARRERTSRTSRSDPERVVAVHSDRCHDCSVPRLRGPCCRSGRGSRWPS